MPSGIELKLAARKATTWGIAVACGAMDGVLMLPGTLKKSRDSKIDDSLGLFWPTDSDPGEIKAAGDRPFYMRYDTLDLLIALFCGIAGAPTYTTPAFSGTASGGTTTTLVDTGSGWTVDAHAGKFVSILSGTGAGQVRKIISNTTDTLTVATWTAPNATSTYEISGGIAQHNYDLADITDGLFATLALNKVINIEEATSAKIAGMSLKGSVGNPLEIGFKIIANNLISNSAVNTLGTFANVTYRDQKNRVLFNQKVYRLNAQSGSALADGDKIYPTEFELTADRKITGVYGAGDVFDTIDEPTNDGIPEVKLKLTFPRYTADTYFTEWDSNTAKKMDMIFTGLLISGTSYRKLSLWFPHLKYATVDAPERREIIQNTVDFNCLSADAAPSGMTGITKPFRLQLVNTFGGDPLQAGN